MPKPDIYDSYDSFDREALRTAQMIAQLAGDVHDLYSTGVELNDPTPRTAPYDQPTRGSDLSDPTGNAATDPRRHQRARQLKATRLALAEALKQVRHALYNSAAAAGP